MSEPIHDQKAQFWFLKQDDEQQDTFSNNTVTFDWVRYASVIINSYVQMPSENCAYITQISNIHANTQ